MVLQRKNWDEMSIKIKKEENRVAVETLLRILMDVSGPAILQRPILNQNDVNAHLKLSRGGYATQPGYTLIANIFSLPYVQEIQFTTSMDFEVVIYTPFDMKDEVFAGIAESEIKACVDKAAGKVLSVVDDMNAPENFEELPAQ